MKNILSLAIFILMLSACEDPEKQYDPKILSLQVNCALNNGVYFLDEIDAVVEDQNGAEDLIVNLEMPMTQNIIAKSLATIFPLNATPIYEKDATSYPQRSSCKKDACLVHFNWSASTESDESKKKISCGADGNGLNLEFRVEDQEGFFATGSKTSSK
jgi:hypothetical protein